MSAGRVYRPRVRRAYDPSHTHFPSCTPEKGCYFETEKYWLKYYVRGECHQEPTHTTSKRDAQRMLREKLAERENGKVIGRPERVSLADLKEALQRRYAREGNRSVVRAQQAFKQLETFLGKDTLALDISPSRVEDYIAHRLEEGAGRGTVRYEVATLSTAFSAAAGSGLLAFRPVFQKPAPAAPRAGFFTTGDLAALLMELPGYVAPVVQFGVLTGWRLDEVLGLTWDHLDWEAATIRLSAAETKGKHARVFPFADAPELMALIQAQWSRRKGVWVFHHAGRPIKSFYKAWKAACAKAGLEGRLFHDLRRTAARNFRLRGVSEGEIMRLCGWETRDMFDRYNIIDEEDLRRSVAKRFPKLVKEEA